jgi:hypothetical protein
MAVIFVVLAVLAIGGLIEGASQKRAARSVPPPKPRAASWERSAEQQMLHANDDIRRWSSDRPY